MEFNPDIHKCGNWYTARHCTKCNIPFSSSVCPKCGTHHSEFNMVAARDIYLKLDGILHYIMYILSLGTCDMEEHVGYEFKKLEERT